MATDDAFRDALLDFTSQQTAFNASLLEKLEASHAPLMAQSASLVVQTASLEAKLNGLEKAQDTLRAALFERIDRLQGSIGLLKEDLGVNFASSNTAITNARSARGEIENLTELVTAMDRRFRVMAAQVEELRQADRSTNPGH